MCSCGRVMSTTANCEHHDTIESANLSSQVELDLDMNAHANARAWHGDRKARTVKQQKTIEANKKALAVADKKVQIQLSKVGCSSIARQIGSC